jgi:hypothetical protein
VTPHLAFLRLAFLLLSSTVLAMAQASQPNGGGVRAGTLPAKWITGGPNCIEVPDWQVHAHQVQWQDFCMA